MKKYIAILLMLEILIQASTLSKEQLKKLNTSVVISKNNNYIIEEYNSVTFKKPVLFGGENIDKIIMKTYSKMEKDIIHKDQFIAISSTASDQLMQSIIFLPEYHQYIDTMELLINKPISVNLTIELNFVKEGIKTKIFSKDRNIERFVPISDIFLIKLP